ncbi:MAG: conjugal transfer protein [Clostridiales bacterium]|nr:conjugal transfer protein [Clostridiales bacterium]
MIETKWIICPECGEKTRVKIKQTTIMKDFLLFCNHCKKEFTVDVENFTVKVIKEN